MASEHFSIQEPTRFGQDLELDLWTRTLRRGGRVLKLERIPLEILVLLVERWGELVTRDEIVARVWGRNVFLDTDNSIRGAIRKIRQVLRDDAEQPQFIQTVTGQGYRFIAVVSEHRAPAALKPFEAPAPLPITPTSVEPPAGKRVRPRWAFALAVAVAVLATSGSWLLLSRSHGQAQPSSARLMLAVLPFDNLTGDPSQEYFSDGVTEEMITQLSRLDPQHLGVIARTSVMNYKRGREPLAIIGRDLRVQYVLEGSVRRDADRVRITAQLIQVKDQTHLWAREYDRGVNHLLNVQAEIAQEVADEIQVALRDDHRPVAGSASLSPQNAEAYDLYLKGRYFWNKRNAQGFRQAVDCFQQAIDKDPKFARAYVGLADSYALMSTYGQVPATEYMPKARAAALRALQIDDNLAEAHTSLALIAQDYDWDWPTADREFRRAIELNPNYATAHHWYAESLAFRGRFEEALAQSESARELDPLSLIVEADNGAILYFAHQYDRAIERFRGVLDADPSLSRAQLIIGAYVEKGQTREALADIERWRRAGDGPWIWAWEAFVYGRAGQRIKAEHAVQELQESAQVWRMDPALMLALAYAGMGDNNDALRYLELAYREHSSALAEVMVEPAFAPLRTDPRFQDLRRRIGLEQ